MCAIMQKFLIFDVGTFKRRSFPAEAAISEEDLEAILSVSSILAVVRQLILNFWNRLERSLYL